MKFKIGFGYDVHQLKNNCKLMIGGVEVPHTKGSFGHSDADVLIHSICDAILGASNLRDIGFHFSDKDPQFKGIDSKILLSKTISLIKNKNFSIGNIDTTIVLEKPKIINFIPKMKSILSKLLDISIDDISIKATTSEKMGFIGNENGICAYSVVLIYKN